MAEFIYKNLYYFVVGGIDGSIADHTASVIVKRPLENVTKTFVSEGFWQLATENLKGSLRKSMKIQSKTPDAWKMGVAAGLGIGIAKSLYAIPAGPSAFKRELIDKVGYLLPYQGFRELNGYLVPKMFKAGNSLPKKILSLAIVGALTVAEATIASIPLKYVMDKVFFGKAAKPIEATKEKSIRQMKKRLPKTTIKVPLYGLTKANSFIPLLKLLKVKYPALF